MIGFSCIIMPLWRAWCTTSIYCISESGGPISRVGIVPEHDISLQEFKHPMIFWQNEEESCTFLENSIVLESWNFRKIPDRL